jgi:cation diffusion facilitator family transporter
MGSREQEIKKASWIGISGNASLSALKITAGLISGSLAVVADGVDSSTDIITSVITLVTASLLMKPPDKKYPYGYDKADTIATKALAFIIFFAGAQLLIATVQKFIHGNVVKAPSPLAIYVTVISIIGKLLLSFHQFRAGKKTGSSMLVANGKNMQNDVLISVSVLIGLAGIFIFKLPLLDTITAFIVSIWVLRVAFKIYMQTSLELMDGTKDSTIYNKIFEVIDSVEGAHHPHRVRARNIGHKVMIAIDLEVDGDLSLRDAHEIAHKVEKALKQNIENVFDVAIHVEPIGDVMEEKAFGINKSSL